MISALRVDCLAKSDQGKRGCVYLVRTKGEGVQNPRRHMYTAPDIIYGWAASNLIFFQRCNLFIPYHMGSVKPRLLYIPYQEVSKCFFHKVYIKQK